MNFSGVKSVFPGNMAKYFKRLIFKRPISLKTGSQTKKLFETGVYRSTNLSFSSTSF
jgi:hypothetical protein